MGDNSSDDTAAATPRAVPVHRRRRRRSSGEGDETLLDAMLHELGIPTSDSKKKTKRQAEDNVVVELLTPPRPPRRVRSSRDDDEEEKECKTEENEDCDRRDDSILDLTTPTPPSSAKARIRSSPRLARQSVVDLLSPDGSDARNSLEGIDVELLVERSKNITLTRRRNLLVRLELNDENGSEEEDGNTEDDEFLREVMEEENRIQRADSVETQSSSRGNERHGSNDGDDSDDDEILREIMETESRIQLSRSGHRKTIARGNANDSLRSRLAALVPARAVVEEVDSLRNRLAMLVPSRPTGGDLDRGDARSDDKATSLPAPKKRGRQKKKQATASPKPPKEVVLAAVGLEKRLFESPVGAAVKAALEGNTYNNKPVPFVLEAAFESDLNVIQWERRGDSRRDEGGDESSRYVIAMHYPAESFLDLLADHGYDALVSAVQWLGEESLNVGRKKTVSWGSVVLIVEGMDRALIARSKKSKSKGPQPKEPITFSDLHELAFRLFMDTSAHTKFTCDVEATASYVALLTREIIVAAVRQTSQEEFLESVPRIHSFRVLPGSGSTLNQFANTWLRMLQMIPGVSEDRAQSVLDHFPTFQSLLRAYNDPSRSSLEKEELLADKLHGTRLESTLSRRIFRVFSGWSESGTL